MQHIPMSAPALAPRHAAFGPLLRGLASAETSAEALRICRTAIETIEAAWPVGRGIRSVSQSDALTAYGWLLAREAELRCAA